MIRTILTLHKYSLKLKLAGKRDNCLFDDLSKFISPINVNHTTSVTDNRESGEGMDDPIPRKRSFIDMLHSIQSWP